MGGKPIPAALSRAWPVGHFAWKPEIALPKSCSPAKVASHRGTSATGRPNDRATQFRVCGDSRSKIASATAATSSRCVTRPCPFGSPLFAQRVLVVFERSAKRIPLYLTKQYQAESQKSNRNTFSVMAEAITKGFPGFRDLISKQNQPTRHTERKPVSSRQDGHRA